MYIWHLHCKHCLAWPGTATQQAMLCVMGGRAHLSPLLVPLNAYCCLLLVLQHNHCVATCYEASLCRGLQGGAFGFIHDILVTDQHYVVLENPIKMNFGKLLSKYAFAKACLAECLEYEATKPTKIHVITRPGKHSSVLGMLRTNVRDARYLRFLQICLEAVLPSLLQSCI